MNTSTRHTARPHRFSLAAFGLLLIAALAPSRALAQQPGQKTFASADEASQALFEAVKANDQKAMSAILGPDANKIITSGDDIEDENTRTNFVTKYQEMHRTVLEPDGTTTLYIGAENWPTPIPLMSTGGAWYFDSGAAADEILFRRVGQNEMSAIQVCQELVAAQKEYFAKQGSVYAQRFVSSEGTHDGLYWLGASNEYESPIGPLVANAGSFGGTAKNLKTGPVPFHGYYFRILTRQGKAASGGEQDYVADGKMTRGFAFVAYPAEYRSTGVMTFLVGSDGVVYEKDLGRRTASAAMSLKSYDPDKSWTKTEDNPPETASTEQKAQ